MITVCWEKRAMTLGDELSKLAELRSSGSLTDE